MQSSTILLVDPLHLRVCETKVLSKLYLTLQCERGIIGRTNLDCSTEVFELKTEYFPRARFILHVVSNALCLWNAQPLNSPFLFKIAQISYFNTIHGFVNSSTIVGTFLSAMFLRIRKNKFVGKVLCLFSWTTIVPGEHKITESIQLAFCFRHPGIVRVNKIYCKDAPDCTFYRFRGTNLMVHLSLKFQCSFVFKIFDRICVERSHSEDGIVWFALFESLVNNIFNNSGGSSNRVMRSGTTKLHLGRGKFWPGLPKPSNPLLRRGHSFIRSKCVVACPLEQQLLNFGLVFEEWFKRSAIQCFA